MTTKPSHELSNITLDRVLIALEHWRNNKKDYDSTGIPDDIWRMVFALEATNTFSASTLRKTLTLNTQQYKTKRLEFVKAKTEPSQARQENSVTPDNQQVKPIDDCTFQEISPPELNASKDDLALQNMQKKIDNLTSPEDRLEDYLDQNTIIVECFHPKGHRLKIHTTNKHIHTVIREFIDNGVMPC